MKKIGLKGILILVVLIILVVGVDIYLVKTKGNNNFGIINNNNGTEKQDNKVNTALKELAYNNYLLSYLLTADVQTADGYVEIEGITYYAVDDELLKDIKTLDDITLLIDKVFEGGLVSLYTNYLSDEKYNNYIYINDHLYIKKGANICHKIAPYNEEIMRFEDGNGENGDKLVVMDEVEVRAVNIDDNWYTTSLEYYCID